MEFIVFAFICWLGWKLFKNGTLITIYRKAASTTALQKLLEFSAFEEKIQGKPCQQVAMDLIEALWKDAPALLNARMGAGLHKLTIVGCALVLAIKNEGDEERKLLYISTLGNGLLAIKPYVHSGLSPADLVMLDSNMQFYALVAFIPNPMNSVMAEFMEAGAQ